MKAVKRDAAGLYKCTVCKAKFKGTGKRGHPWTRCPKCRRK